MCIILPCYRYAILAPAAQSTGFVDTRKAAGTLLENMSLEANEYRMGHTKVNNIGFSLFL